MASSLVVALTADGNALENPSAGYEVVTFGRGAGNYRRESVESPYVKGSVLVGWIEDVQVARLVMTVKGATQAELLTRFETLLGWLRPADGAWTLVESFGATAWSKSYVCEPADYELGDGDLFNPFLLGEGWQRVTFTIRHAPV